MYVTVYTIICSIIMKKVYPYVSTVNKYQSIMILNVVCFLTINILMDFFSALYCRMLMSVTLFVVYHLDHTLVSTPDWTIREYLKIPEIFHFLPGFFWAIIFPVCEQIRFKNIKSTGKKGKRDLAIEKDK